MTQITHDYQGTTPARFLGGRRNQDGEKLTVSLSPDNDRGYRLTDPEGNIVWEGTRNYGKLYGPALPPKGKPGRPTGDPRRTLSVKVTEAERKIIAPIMGRVLANHSGRSRTVDGARYRPGRVK